MEEEKEGVEVNILEEEKNINPEPKDEIIKILTEMKQEQLKSNKSIKCLLAFSGLVMAALFIFFFCVIVL